MSFEKVASDNPKLGSALGAVKRHFTRGAASLPKETIRGLKHKAMVGGGTPDSFLSLPLVWAARKIKGDASVNKALWRKVHRPAISADTAAGNVAHDLVKKVPGLKKLFLMTEKIPVKRKGESLFKEISRPSLLAPLAKAQAVASPFVFGLAAEKTLRDLRGVGRKESVPPGELVAERLQG